MGENHIQLMHDGVNHWLLSFSSSGRIQLCDSLHTNISSVTKSVKAIYKSLIDKDRKLTITIEPVRSQKGGYNCELFAIAFASDILQEISVLISPTESCFDISRMREHLIECLEKEKLSVFPKQASVAVNKGYEIFELFMI